MSLPDDYLTYPNRRYGQDISRYEWRAPRPRPDAGRDAATGGALSVAIIVPLEYFMLDPSGAPFKHPGAMSTAYPDLRHYTTRDYGNRVGAYRLLKALEAANARATFAVNAALLTRTQPLIRDILADGHEIAAHGVDTDSIHWGGIDPHTEKNYVAQTRDAFEAEGLAPRAWMSPARQQSANTPDLIRAAGFDICLDWESDTIPLEMTTASGALMAMPVLNELDDRNLLVTKRQTEAEWRDQIVEAAALMASEAPRFGPQCFGFTLTPYIAGLPFRIRAVRDMLSRLRDLAQLSGVSEIVDGFSLGAHNATD